MQSALFNALRREVPFATSFSDALHYFQRPITHDMTPDLKAAMFQMYVSPLLSLVMPEAATFGQLFDDHNCCDGLPRECRTIRHPHAWLAFDLTGGEVDGSELTLSPAVVVTDKRKEGQAGWYRHFAACPTEALADAVAETILPLSNHLVYITIDIRKDGTAEVFANHGDITRLVAYIDAATIPTTPVMEA